MAITKVTTARFAVSWEATNSIDSQRANALLLTCENDLTQLFALIGTPSAVFDSTNQIQVLVGISAPDVPKAPGGANRGYAKGNGTTIYIDSYHLISGPALDEVRLILVAELAEVLNSAWPNPTGLLVGSSMSEGLSRAMAAELYPNTYYGSTKFNASQTPNRWLSTVSQVSPGDWEREDWINKTADDETTSIATGCAILFLNFLRYQQGFTWHQILQAGGPLLADTYERLTGKKTAWQDFRQLIEEHIPAAAYSTGSPALLKTNNPFPLLPVISRDGLPARGATMSQSFGVGSSTVSSVPHVHAVGTVHIPACPLAEAKDYTYVQFNVAETLKETFTYHGFAFPQILAWNLLDPGTDKYTQVGEGDLKTLTLKTSVENPEAPGEFTTSTQSVPVRVSDSETFSNFETQQNSLSFSNTTYPGQFQIQFFVTIHEQLVPAEITRLEGVLSFDTLPLVMDDSYATDKQKCESNFWKIVNRYVRIPPLVHMPKPEPPIGWREALQWSAQVRQDLAKNYRANPREVQHVADLLAKYFGVDVEEFLKEANVKGA